MMTDALLARLIREVSDLTARVDALWRVMEAHGIAAEEIDAAYRQVRAEREADFARSREAATKAAALGELEKQGRGRPQ